MTTLDRVLVVIVAILAGVDVYVVSRAIELGAL